MTAVTPSGALPVWIVTLAALTIIAAAIVVGLVKNCSPERHERSIHYRNRRGRQDL